jgi:hypothetical protein
MSKISTLAGRVLLGLALPLASTLAVAQTAAPTELGRVDLSGSAAAKVIKFDVQRACPGIGAELQEALGSMMWRYGEQAAVRVDFKLSGKQVMSVRTPMGLGGIDRPIKRAVKSLSCDTDQAETENYAFMLQFVESDSARDAAHAAAQSGERIALLTVARP